MSSSAPAVSALVRSSVDLMSFSVDWTSDAISDGLRCGAGAGGGGVCCTMSDRDARTSGFMNGYGYSLVSRSQQFYIIVFQEISILEKLSLQNPEQKLC